MGFMILRYVKLLFYVVQVLYRNFLQQYDSREEPDCRGRLHSAKDGSYSFRGVVWADFLFFAFKPQRISWITSPVSYPVPFDGTVGKMLEKLGRHTMRPAHLHIRINVYYNSFFSFSLSYAYYKPYFLAGTGVWRVGHGPLFQRRPLSHFRRRFWCEIVFDRGKFFGCRFRAYDRSMDLGNWDDQWSRDFESTRVQGLDKTTCILETEFCVGNGRWSCWITKEVALVNRLGFCNHVFSKSQIGLNQCRDMMSVQYQSPLFSRLIDVPRISSTNLPISTGTPPQRTVLCRYHHHLMDGLHRGKRFYLCGFPIARSTAPAFHNHLFNSWHTGTPNVLETWSTSRITDELVGTFSQDDFGGAAWVASSVFALLSFLMETNGKSLAAPLQQEMLSYLQEISPESKATGACNTIVKVPTVKGFKLVGQNTEGEWGLSDSKIQHTQP